MLDDVTPPERRLKRPKPKRIEPISKPVPAVSLHEQAKAADASFQTPDEVAALDRAEPETIVAQHEAPKAHKLKLGWPRTKKQRIFTGVAVMVLVAGIGAGWTLTHHKRAVEAVAPKKTITKKAVKPVVIYSTLTGLPVADASVNQRTVTAAMIENSLDARPQSGLGDAGVVFEAVAEGGVTRFMALFQDTAPANIGPIRSARPYYVSWALGFDAAYAHVGGSDAALADITA